MKLLLPFLLFTCFNVYGQNKYPKNTIYTHDTTVGKRRYLYNTDSALGIFFVPYPPFYIVIKSPVKKCKQNEKS